MMEKTVKIDKIYLFLLVLSVLIALFFQMLCCPFSRQSEVFFKAGEDLGKDYYNLLECVKSPNIYLGEKLPFGRAELAYPPVAYLPMRCCNYIVQCVHSKNKNNQNILFLILSVALTALLMQQLSQFLNFSNGIRNLFIFCLLFSGVFLFSLERGNVILFVAFLVSYFIFHYRSSNPIEKECALIALALAASMKITPALLGALTLAEKDWRSTLKLCIYGLFFFFTPFLFIPHHFYNIFYLIDNMKMFSQWHMKIDHHTMTELYPFLLQKIGISVSALNIWYISAVSGLLALIISFWEKRYWCRVTLVIFAILLLPTVSGSYCYLYLFPCLVLFFSEGENDNISKIIAILLALFLNPLQITDKLSNYTCALRSLWVDCIFICVFYQSLSANDSLRKLHCFNLLSRK